MILQESDFKRILFHLRNRYMGLFAMHVNQVLQTIVKSQVLFSVMMLVWYAHSILDPFKSY